jgi:hypothetical protein
VKRSLELFKILGKVIVENKEAIDALKRDWFSQIGIEPIPFSAVTREGKDLLWNLIFSVIK